MNLPILGHELQNLATSPVPGTVGATPETPAHKKLVQAAQEFEGVLISQLMDDFKNGMTCGDDQPMAGSDTLNSLAIQTLSRELARQGVLGIGKMAVHQLETHLHDAKSAQGGKSD